MKKDQDNLKGMNISELTAEEIGDMHLSTNIETPLRDDAFALSDDEKIAKIEEYFHGIMHTLGLNMEDDSLSGTPHRVAKMYVKEMFSGLNPANKPKLTTFDNKYEYDKMLIEKNITINSACEHHFLPIIGKAHVAYISSGRVIGLSKINRIVNYYARRPQVQERHALQVLNELKNALNTEHVAVIIEAKHLCVSTRGVEDQNSSTVTVEFSGKFNEKETKDEFLRYISSDLMQQL
tara:strand:- start:914 stop:1621 length:708 start_codon:yes stop_codon:yes gene_type:complete